VFFTQPRNPTQSRHHCWFLLTCDPRTLPQEA